MGDIDLYRVLKYTAIALVVSTLLIFMYNSTWVRVQDPYLSEYDRATRDFKDRLYKDALEHYNLALNIDPEGEGALRGKADSLSLLGEHLDALDIYNQLIGLNPQQAAYYANRGIINDRLGRYEQAIVDYELAYKLDSELDDGPGWLTRFLRNQQGTPATILARAQYLRYQLSLPVGERVLHDEKQDGKQRPHNR